MESFNENMNVMPLISVIVLIYNVVPYVRKCLDSLKKQSLKEIEVICVDDGSTDGSGAIAEEYISNEFPIFKIIHTDNRGLSSARNRGIDEARTEWILFVDSDDWADPRLCEISYKAAIENQADMVIFGTYSVNWNGKARKAGIKSDIPVGIVDAFTAHEYGEVVTWNKLYAKRLFDGIKYPEGRLYEDKAITHRVVNASKRIAMINDRLYFHVVRKGSISHTYTRSNRKDCFIANMERYNDLLEFGFPEKRIKSELCSSALGFLASSGQVEDELHEEAQRIIESVNCFPKSYPLWKKIALFVWKKDKKLFYRISRLAGRMNKV